MYAHLNALVLADYLGADVVLPPSVFRESFAKYFSMDLTKNEVKWTPTDTGALLDVHALREHYARKGELFSCLLFDGLFFSLVECFGRRPSRSTHPPPKLTKTNNAPTTQPTKNPTKPK